MTTLELADGRTLPLDENGYLLCIDDWDRSVAEQMAAADGLELGAQHWAVIEMLRDYYGEYDIAPPMRALVKIAGNRLGSDFSTSRVLYQLFPEGPARQACRYAGLPRTVSCI